MLNRRRFLKLAGTAALVAGVSFLNLEESLRAAAGLNASTEYTVVEASTATGSPIVPLRVAATSRGLLVGAAARPEQLADASYAETLAREYNFVTPENAMKWMEIESDGFGPADQLVDFATAHQMKVKGHTLVWDGALPARINDQMSTDELREAVQDHILSEVGHFKGRVCAWDVVNEAMDFEGLKKNIFLEKLGDGYIADTVPIGPRG